MTHNVALYILAAGLAFPDTSHRAEIRFHSLHNVYSGRLRSLEGWDSYLFHVDGCVLSYQICSFVIMLLFTSRRGFGKHTFGLVRQSINQYKSHFVT